MKTILTFLSLFLLFTFFAFVDITENQVVIGTGDICALAGNPEYSLIVHSGKAYKDNGSMWATPADSSVLEKTMPLQQGLAFIDAFQPIKGVYKKSTPKAGQAFVGFHAATFADQFPESVYEVPFNSKTEEKNMLVADPSVLPYISINAIKELHQKTKKLEEQQHKIQQLENRLARLEAKLGSLSKIKEKNPNPSLSITGYLGQNFPNPTKGFTQIPYEIPVGSAGQITISDAQGRLIHHYDQLANKGNLAVDLAKLRLSEGAYFYTLVVDGRTVDAKGILLVE